MLPSGFGRGEHKIIHPYKEKEMKLLSKAMVFLFIAVIFSGCSSANKFMIRDTGEYRKATEKILGDWGVTEYTVDGENLLKTKYKKMTANFDFSTRTVIFTIWVADGTISDKLLDWKKEYPDITVDEYKITYTAKWEVADDIFIYFREPVTDLVIKGSGKNFEGFYAWEKSKFNMAKSSDDGSLFGAAMGSITQAATGTSDLFPEFSDSYKYKIFDGESGGFALTAGDNKIVFAK